MPHVLVKRWPGKSEQQEGYNPDIVHNAEQLYKQPGYTM